MPHILKTNVNGNPNVGLYGFATDKFCLLGREVKKSLADEIQAILDVPVFQINVAGTSLLGVFIAGNEKDILVPNIIFDTEMKKLKKIAEEAGFNIHIIDTDLTALGNNMLCNDKGCLLNPDFPAGVKKQVEEAMGVDVKSGKIADLPTVGAVAASNGKGCAMHRDAEQFEFDFVKDILKVKTEASTVNLGNPFIRSGVLVNSNGFIVGNQSGGPEVTYLDEVFGFIEN